MQQLKSISQGTRKTGTFQLTAATLSFPGVFVAVLGAIIAIWIWYALAGRAA